MNSSIRKIIPTDLIHRIGIAASAETIYRAITTEEDIRACPKAVLKPPHSGRWRDCRTSPNLAKRLDCGVFTAAFLAGQR